MRVQANRLWLLFLLGMACLMCSPGSTADLYQGVKILTPESEATVHSNNGNLNVSIEITPPLRTAGGDYLVLLMDGAEVARGFTHSTELKDIERGSHTLQVQVRAADGTLLVASTPLSFTMWRASALFPGRVPET